MQTYKAMANLASDEKDLKTFILDDLTVGALVQNFAASGTL